MSQAEARARSVVWFGHPLRRLVGLGALAAQRVGRGEQPALRDCDTEHRKRREPKRPRPPERIVSIAAPHGPQADTGGKSEQRTACRLRTRALAVRGHEQAHSARHHTRGRRALRQSDGEQRRKAVGDPEQEGAEGAEDGSRSQRTRVVKRCRERVEYYLSQGLCCEQCPRFELGRRQHGGEYRDDHGDEEE
eukprot:3930681-Prymnesium_polylepis.2